MASWHPVAAACAGLAASLTACAAPTEFQSAEELAALIESHGFDYPDPFKLRDYYLFECGNEAVDRIAEETNTKSFHAYW